VTQLFDVSGLRRVASPRDQKVHLGGDRVEILALVLRLVGVGFLSAVGWIHLHLWQTGYRHIPTIGPLFLVAAVSAFVIGAGLLARPSRLMGLSGIGLATGVLAGLIVSVNAGLFGFKESLSAPFSVESIVLEIAAAVTVAAWMAVDFMKEGRHTEPTQAAPANSSTTRDASVDPPARSSGADGSRRHHGADRWQQRAWRAEDDAEQLAPRPLTRSPDEDTRRSPSPPPEGQPPRVAVGAFPIVAPGPHRSSPSRRAKTRDV
jgi:hypothetical protein